MKAVLAVLAIVGLMLALLFVLVIGLFVSDYLDGRD